jgi:preprotein translocase subunit SecF
VFQLLKNPQFDFMRRRNLLLSISLVLVAVSVGILFVHGINLGIEFSGGTELQVKYAATPDISAIRSTLADEGLTSQVVTTIGDPSENEVYIRLGDTGDDGDEGATLTTRVSAALRAQAGGVVDDDLNVIAQSELVNLLRLAPGVGDPATLATAISERRKDVAIFHSIDELADVPGMTPEVQSYLGQNAAVGPLAVRSQSYIGPAIGRELMNKALFAVIGSLVGMLIYIWIRFQLQWGFAAVVALTHDTLITLGLFSLFGKEMSLPVVAAFLTLIGYSVNDTVVVFDRVRENLKIRRTEGLEAVINLSINQTLSRTVITSGLTWVVVFGLYLFGGAALNPFSFVLSVGVLVGTYSSIYVASPILVLWKRFVDNRRGSGAGAAQRGTKKVRTSSAG